MSDTKIVIDKEQILSLIKSFENVNDFTSKAKASLLNIILRESTEIQIDQSIEDLAISNINKYFTIYPDDSIDTDFETVRSSLEEIATSQQIIEQFRVKEKIIDYIEKDAEILIPIEEWSDENGNAITKREYGRVLLKYLVIELRSKFLTK